MLGCIEAVHQVDSLEEDLLILDVDLGAHFKEPVDHGRTKLSSDLNLISQQGVELRLVFVRDHVIKELASVIF